MVVIKKKQKIYLIVTTFLLLVTVIYLYFAFFSRTQITIISGITNQQIAEYKVKTAITPLAQKKGLQRINSLKEDHGMLFIFTDGNSKSFWMKETLIPLDIIFIDENYLITQIFTNVMPCTSNKCPVIIADAKYVLELNGKQTIQKKITPGDKLRFKQ